MNTILTRAKTLMTTDQLHGPLSTGADSPSNSLLMDQHTSSQHPLDVLDIPEGENSPPRGLEGIIFLHVGLITDTILNTKG